MDEQKPEDNVPPQDDDSEKTDSASIDDQDNDSTQDKDNKSWVFNQNDDDQPPNVPANTQPLLLSWNASEFMEHEKSSTWYVYLFFITIVIGAGIYFLTKDKITTAVIVIAGVVFGYFGARKPKNVNYQLDGDGIMIGQKFYDYNSFKSFALIDDSHAPSLVLIPLKRFMPSLALFYDRKDEKKIMDILSIRLPLEQRRDAIDSFMRRIRF
jgi:hypothetical protein